MMTTDTGQLLDIDASAIAPDTRGMNFYRDDQALRDLLALYLPDDLFAHLQPHLDRLGGLRGVGRPASAGAASARSFRP
jgi:acyl-CoA dehydrogenase